MDKLSSLVEVIKFMGDSCRQTHLLKAIPNYLSNVLHYLVFFVCLFLLLNKRGTKCL